MSEIKNYITTDSEKILDDDPEFQVWLDEIQRSSLEAMIEDYDDE